jgi:type VI secretion system secreted protein Hcp
MATSIFLHLDGITGDSKIEQHVGDIQLISATFSGSDPISMQSGRGAAVGKVSFGPLIATKHFDSSSQSLFLKMCKGTSIATGRLSFANPNTSPYLTVDFTSLRIAGIVTSSASEPATDSISLTYETILLTYRNQNPDGSFSQPTVVGWNLSTNSAIVS